MATQLTQGFRVGDWAVEPLRGEIVGPQGRLHLEPKVMDVLVCLAERPGEVVTREELLASVWGRAMTDEPLNRVMAELRRALGDNRREPKYIQTVPKRGYRFVAPVQLPETPPASEPSSSTLYTLLKELGQRKVFRVAAVYVSVSWLLVEAMTLPTFNVADSTLRGLVTALVVGFPLVIALAWMFRVSPTGLKRTPAVVTGPTLFPYPWLKYTAAACTSIVMVATIWWIWSGDASAPARRTVTASPYKENPVVAVLPMQTPDGQKEYAWLGEGLAELVRNGLAQSRRLVVVSKWRWNAIARLGGEQTMEQAAQAGIDYVVVGQFIPSPDGLTLTTYVSDLAAGIDLDPTTELGFTTDRLLATAERITQNTKAQLGVPPQENIDNMAADFAVSDPAAYQYFVAGLGYFDQFDYKEAASSFDAALKLEPDFYMAQLKLAHVYSAQGFTTKALAVINAIPDDATMSRRSQLYIAAAQHWFADEYEEAQARYEELLEEFPFEIEAREDLAQILWAMFAEDASIQQLRLIALQEPQNTSTWASLATSYLETGSPEEAKIALDRYLELKPNDPFGYTVLGDYALETDDAATAVAHYRTALNFRADFPLAKLALARALAQAGDYAQAQATWTEIVAAVDAPPDERIAGAFDFADILRAQGQFAAAAQVLADLQDVFREEQKHDAKALALRGLDAMELGDGGLAGELIDRAVTRAPSAWPPTRYLFARGLLELGRSDHDSVATTAKEIRQHALPKPDPDRTEDKAADYLEGLVLLTTGHSDDAVNSLQAAVSAEGYRYAIYELGLAQALATKGHDQAALEQVAIAIGSRDPGEPPFDLELDRVRARVLEAELTARTGDLQAARQLATTVLSRWQGDPAHPIVAPARSLLLTQ